MQTKRRVFLKGSLAASAAGLAVGAGLLSPRAVLASEWPTAAFDATKMDAGLNELFGTADAAESGDVSVKAPDIAENGAVVPVTVESSIADANQVAIFVSKNPTPLVASFDLSGANPFVSTRIRMGETDNVTGVVNAGGKLYKASKEVKVTIGGCGG
ncbi:MULTISPECIES: thiosulfate oxidation carrier protein SoxY [unclassified Guyparkeria]|uniref:thiosulfate oxidation carrier protein SoxY n=1 Tax=unclassified Guyparkeria TaxID=2626246 RepID=UPI0007338E84|nr:MULTISPECIES: thiosulfate oxidation carrier protein SoxY [unclassified Guyparkeria]KTG16936.1 thiosulfate oxidation carrier protein SoxY [Guyparkeria sp. XI15]OAE85970.1 thiosulfate oxidation carrier protein SoxY [Guyparkeria sp. WRN-7]